MVFQSQSFLAMETSRDRRAIPIPDRVVRPRKNRSTTEQLIPRRRGSQDSEKTDFSTLNREVMNEDLTLRVLLLSPLDMDHDFPILCEKSTVDAYSHTGSVSIEMIRLPGTVNHHFRLYVTSCEENVNVVLPPGFRGAIYVNKAGCLFPKVQMSTGLRKGIDDGAVHMNPPCVDEDEDEVHITAAKSVQLRMVEDNVCREEKDRPLWIVESAGRIARVSRAFLFKDKTS